VILTTFGEETGWRGFALPLLQRRYGALAAALLITPIWALWHLPYFFTVTTYRGFAPVGYVGFVFGLACGSIVLTWLYNGTGGSILACAVWHGLYNLETGTAAATSVIQAVTSAFVYVLAFLLVGFELRARRRGGASILGPRRGSPPPRSAR
jgi:membrane protease YdiL (CAAX protease family)